MRATLPAALVLFLLACPAAVGQESRAFNPIARPAAPPVLPDGAIRVSPPRPVERARIEAAVNVVARAWSDRAVDAVLAPGFDRRAELADALQTKVPRDASLRVIGIQGWQVLDQYRLAGALVTKVSVTVRTQVEFNDAALGFQAREGTNEYLLTLNDAEAR